MRLLLSTILGGTMLLIGCTSGPPFNPVVGNSAFQSYVRDSLTGRRSDEGNVNLRRALRGDPSGTQYFFAESYQRAVSSYPDPAEDVALGWLLQTVLLKNGDLAFAELLAKEPPDVQSAVFYFLIDQLIPKDYVHTRALFRASPQIVFPLEKAYQSID